jgi:RimJ/RimL family protein N-acetyltransferase
VTSPRTFDPSALDALPIRTEHLLIRPIETTDADDVAAYQELPDVVRYLPWPRRDRDASRAHTELRARNRVLASDGDSVALAIELVGEPTLGADGDRVIGDLTLIVSSVAHAQLAVGWVLHPQFQGKGLATEAAAALLDLAVTMGAHRVSAVLDASNAASAALCERLGMRREAQLHEDRFDDGSWRDTITYAILARHWVGPATREPTSDHEAVASVVRTFFEAFTSGPGCDERLDALPDLFLAGAVVVRTCGAEQPVLYDVAGFIAPRRALLTGGTLTDFREWEVDGRTDVFGDVAQHFCTYAKEWREGGVLRRGRGKKTLQLVRTERGWRISAAAWDDERDGLSIDDAGAIRAAR